jgi:hypothetical protein
MLRSILAVVIGYVLFAASAFAMFRVTGQAPHAIATTSFMLLSSAGGMLGACIGGYAAGWIAGGRPLAHGIAVGLVLALGATVSLVSTLGHGEIWSQLTALLLMAPSAALGGWLRAKQTPNART